MSSPDYSATIRGPQGWISTTGSSLSSTKTTAFVRSLTSDLQLGHKKYYRVYLQPLYTTPPESSPFDHPHATMCQSKFRQNSFTHLTCHKGCSDLVATVTVGIVFLLPTSSIKNRPHWMSHAPSCIAKTFCNVKYMPHALPELSAASSTCLTRYTRLLYAR